MEYNQLIPRRSFPIEWRASAKFPEITDPTTLRKLDALIEHLEIEIKIMKESQIGFWRRLWLRWRAIR